MIDHHEPPHWVVERAKCNLELVFDALCQILERDVNEVNELPERQRHGRHFLFAVNTDGPSPIAQVNQEHGANNPARQQVYARFQRGDAAITIQASSLSHAVHARVRWDEGARSCKLYVEATKPGRVRDPHLGWLASPRGPVPAGRSFSAEPATGLGGKRCPGSRGRRSTGWCGKCCPGNGSGQPSCCGGLRIRRTVTNGPNAPMPSAAPPCGHHPTSLPE